MMVIRYKHMVFKRFLSLLITISGSLYCLGCGDKKVEPSPIPVTEMDHPEKFINDTIITISGFEVEIRIPKSEVRGDLLVLPGWGFSRTRWCNETELCTMALARGYRVILPEMGKSVYQAANYPETRKDWAVFPTRDWVNNNMIPALQKEGLLTNEKPNYIMGLSTGARGVILICLDNPDLFNAAAALSGDLDQTLMREDNLMNGVYGKYSNFKERWEGNDNPTSRIKDWNTPLYLGHGKADHVVPVDQTKLFYRKLKEQKREIPVMLNLANAGHDFNYWGAEVKPILDFFSQFSKN
jgi:S-formylglutathione hydrolase FrmB